MPRQARLDDGRGPADRGGRCYVRWRRGSWDTRGRHHYVSLHQRPHVRPHVLQKGEEHLSFEDFWKILEKNRNRIQANLKSRELYEDIKSEYEKSLSKLLPLKEKLRKTDWLIDQIVYKLYGLSDEEIKIVEGHTKTGSKMLPDLGIEAKLRKAEYPFPQTGGDVGVKRNNA